MHLSQKSTGSMEPVDPVLTPALLHSFLTFVQSKVCNKLLLESSTRTGYVHYKSSDEKIVREEMQYQFPTITMMVHRSFMGLKFPESQMILACVVLVTF